MVNRLRRKNIRNIIICGVIACGGMGCAHSRNGEFTCRLPEVPARYHSLSSSTAGGEALSWFTSCGDTVLQGYLQKMLAGNPSILQMSAAVERSKAAYGIVNSGTYPNINLSVSAGTIRRPEDAQTQHYYLSVPATYELDVWKKLKARKQAAFLEVKATQQDKQALTITMTAELMERYYEGLFILRQGHLLDVVIDLARRINTLEAKRYKEGVIAKQDVYRSEQQLDEYIALRLRNRAELSRVEHALKILMGESPCD
ncbi:MAG: TolC family protein, partial [Candidatus Omnitrophica bacterium]|nr:TolC family protein [Candidatus Omnitrophota bacterium]